MRDVIFRGKSVKTKEWVSGYYCNCSLPNGNQKETGHYIVEFPNKYHEIYTDTVGQYTGLRDKNGIKIFEGDIVKYGKQTRGTVRFGEYLFDCYGYYIEWTDRMVTEKDLYCWAEHRAIEVVGNIYDDPELMEEVVG